MNSLCTAQPSGAPDEFVMIKTLIGLVLGVALIVTGFIAYKVRFDNRPDMPGALVIRGARLLDGTGRPPIENAVIIIEKDVIKKVFREGEGSIPAGAQVVNAEQGTIMPGIIDCDVRLMIGSAGSAASAKEFLPDRALKDLRACLYWGNTTVYSAGDPPQLMLRLRDNEREGLMPSPRIYLAGPILTAEGGYPAVFLPPAIAADSTRQLGDTESAAKTVEALASENVSVIKLVYEGDTRLREYKKLSLELLKDVTRRAHELGLKVSARVGTVDDLKDAVRAGADAVETDLSDLLDQEAVGLMVERGTLYCSRLSTHRNAAFTLDQIKELIGRDEVREFTGREVLEGLESRTGYFFEIKNDSEIDEQLRAVWEANRQNLLLASQGGVRIFMGTGAGDPTVFYGYSAHEELRLMTESGLSPMQALVAATKSAADFLGLGDRLGTIEAGKLADILIVNGNPLEDISATRRLKQVIKGGRVIDRDQLTH